MKTFLRDTVNVPYYDGRSLAYPSIRIRMDFRDPDTVGIFPYHCHLLEHEDKGMMGSIQVVPRHQPRRNILWKRNAIYAIPKNRVRNSAPKKLTAVIDC